MQTHGMVPVLHSGHLVRSACDRTPPESGQGQQASLLTHRHSLLHLYHLTYYITAPPPLQHTHTNFNPPFTLFNSLRFNSLYFSFSLIILFHLVSLHYIYYCVVVVFSCPHSVWLQVVCICLYQLNVHKQESHCTHYWQFILTDDELMMN